MKREIYVFLAAFTPVYVGLWLVIGTKALLMDTAITIAVFGWTYLVFKAFYGKEL